MRKYVVLYLIGAFVFAFLLGELVHEYGHFMMHMIFKHEGVSVVIDPFGGSKNIGVTAMPYNEVAWTTILGPMTNVILATLIYFIFFKIDFLPIKIWMPIALVQEGVTFSIGSLTTGGDAYWISESTGINIAFIVVFGVILLSLGVWMISKELSGISEIKNLNIINRILLLFFGFGSLMIIRALYSIFINLDLLVENLVPLAFSLIIAIIVALIINDKAKEKTVNPIKAYNSLMMGVFMFIYQIII